MPSKCRFILFYSLYFYCLIRPLIEKWPIVRAAAVAANCISALYPLLMHPSGISYAMQWHLPMCGLDHKWTLHTPTGQRLTMVSVHSLWPLSSPYSSSFLVVTVLYSIANSHHTHIHQCIIDNMDLINYRSILGATVHRFSDDHCHSEQTTGPVLMIINEKGYTGLRE